MEITATTNSYAYSAKTLGRNYEFNAPETMVVSKKDLKTNEAVEYEITAGIDRRAVTSKDLRTVTAQERFSTETEREKWDDYENEAKAIIEEMKAVQTDKASREAIEAYTKILEKLATDNLGSKKSSEAVKILIVVLLAGMLVAALLK